MKHINKIFLLLLVLINISCESRHSSKKSFLSYDSKFNRIESDGFIVNKQNDTVTIYKNKIKIGSYRQLIDSLWIKQSCCDSMTIIYSFAKKNIFHCIDLNMSYVPPFYSNKTNLIADKKNFIKDKYYNIYLFEQHTGNHDNWGSYYCKEENLDFFMYYNMDEDRYLIAKTGIPKQDSIISVLCRFIVNDSAFSIEHQTRFLRQPMR